jgi:adenylyltransferase/sulfurtransferase
MATEAIKLITGAGRTLLGRLAVYDALELTWRHLTVRRDPGRVRVTSLPDDAAYATSCGLPPTGAPGSVTPRELDALRSAAAAADGAEPYVLDVREPREVQVATLDGVHVVPSGTFAVAGADRDAAVAEVARRAAGRTVHVLCKTGPRAARVAAMLRDAGLDAREVAGGIAAWSRDIDPSVPTY